MSSDLLSALPTVEQINADIERAFAEDFSPGDATAELLPVMPARMTS